MSHSNLKEIYIILTYLVILTTAKNIDNETNGILNNQTLIITTKAQISENAVQNETAIENLKKDVKAKLIELEKEKKELFIALNKAIDSAVESLKGNPDDNTTREGLEQLSQLKEQIRLLNEADDKGPSFRRKATGTKPEDEMTEDLLMRSMWQISNVDKHHKQSKNRELHRIEVEKRLDSWLENRIRIKKQKKERDIRLGKETCPRFGRKGGGRKGKERKSRKKDKGSKKGKRYPCCRKCCKQSILKCF